MELFEGHHSFVCGMTGTGKTAFVLNRLKDSRFPVFFFNFQHIDTPFLKCDGAYDTADLIEAIKSGDKIDFRPSKYKSFAKQQLNYIVNEFFAKDQFRNKPFYFVVDEAHETVAQGEKNDYVLMIPTRGRSLGYMGIFLTQRPALIDKTVISQCTKHFIFYTEYEVGYFRTKGLDVQTITNMLGTRPEDFHNYVVYERGQYTGPFKEQL